MRSTHSSASWTSRMATSKRSNRAMASWQWRWARAIRWRWHRRCLRSYGDFRQPMAGFFLGGNGTVSSLLEPSPYFIELIKGMETIIALLGLRENFPHPGFDPLRGVLDHDRQIQPLLLALFEHLSPVLATACLAQRQTKQVSAVEIHAR